MMMKCEMKCDVEISITADGEEFETLSVPPCLQSAALGACNSEHSGIKNAVLLPNRYLQKLINDDKNLAVQENDTDSREKDLDTALKWIKQEIMNMKEQDKCLMKQFIDLRSSIMQLRYMFEMNSSCSDVSSMSGSNMSLDDSLRAASPYGSPGFLSPIHADIECLEFRSRTSSLLTPKRPPVTRIKWKSHEYI